MRAQWARQRGVTLIEVLVTILILSIGLLGMAGLQVRLQQSEMEAYQRAQALLLLSDMANRIAANRNAAEDYVTGADSPVGVGSTCSTSTTSRKDIDLGEWCNALQGAAETTGSNASKVGAMLGGRGCVESLGSNEYLITVAWQGEAPIAVPPTSVACGADEYDGEEGSACANDLCRRVVTTIVRVAEL
ncbi:type IV pilus assembly protein PilV [Azotobacter beijerinckii]|uniref:Type IV pilus assembly protein PilV n=1 Tax=Azotobacter beijerinckii TaxID=170623 RepID=A0A1H9JFT2_9GAMM|nr:type IV pilus modification protein PilV [Azotobacter beijerinckii]SEQ85764.1 type IV pilus assembly protein PilV [Azotobacter beijerinckii]